MWQWFVLGVLIFFAINFFGGAVAPQSVGNGVGFLTALGASAFLIIVGSFFKD